MDAKSEEIMKEHSRKITCAADLEYLAQTKAGENLGGRSPGAVGGETSRISEMFEGANEIIKAN